MLTALSLLAISTLVIVHELGHLLVARACGMRVLCFSIGFGPTLLSRQVGEITWQLAAIPMGGYVQIDGMSGGEVTSAAQGEGGASTQPSTDRRLFNSRPIWQRIAVILAGPATNWLTCALLLVALAAGAGLPQLALDEARLGEVQLGGPAAQAGLQAGDRILSLDAQPLADWDALVQAVRARPGHKSRLEIARDGQQLERWITPRDSGGSGLIEVAPFVRRTTYGFGASLAAGFAAACEQSRQQTHLLAGLFTGRGHAQLSGLPGIVKAVRGQAAHSASRLFEQLASLSMGLCWLNLLPVPALDGSRLLFLLLEWVRRRPLDERVEGLVHTAGFVLLLGVMAFVSLRDLVR